jgi:selenide,water dikinase
MTTSKPVQEIRLTALSHGAGCGCKISPSVLHVILQGNESASDFPGLLVGNQSRDDAAVLDLGDGNCLISTTDFFMPVVDDPYDFGRIASANAISDVYAMGGTPLMAIAILGWPVDKVPAEVASRVLAGSRAVCANAGIPLAGGHSIDSPEPIFGLAVTGRVQKENIKQNNTAKEGDLLFLTKPVGIGIYTTASKRNCIDSLHLDDAVKWMTKLNNFGAALSEHAWIHAMTDVTGFGLLGHLVEMTEGSNLSAEIKYSEVPLLKDVHRYLDMQCIPGGTRRNWNSYGHHVGPVNERIIDLLADPQTSGGLLIAMDPDHLDDYKALCADYGMPEFACRPIGSMTGKGTSLIMVR